MLGEIKHVSASKHGVKFPAQIKFPLRDSMKMFWTPSQGAE